MDSHRAFRDLSLLHSKEPPASPSLYLTELQTFGAAHALGRTHSDRLAARCRLEACVGHAGVVDAAGVVGGFDAVTRIVDATAHRYSAQDGMLWKIALGL